MSDSLNNAIVSIENFSKRYGSIVAVSDISLNIDRGELFGLIGPDGAGKTTTMRTLVTLLQVQQGTMRVDGLDVTKDVSKIREIVGYMPQRFSLYPDLSIEQNLNFFADLFGVTHRERDARKKRLYQFSRLELFADRLAGKLSGGMKQKLALSCTLIHEPKLLVLDEPTTGVDPVSRNEFWNILKELRSEGVTILVSTPYMDEAVRCDTIAVMHEGRILIEGKPENISDAFPDQLFALHSDDVVREGNLVQTLPIVEMVQAFGDSLHIAVNRVVSESTLRSHLQTALQRPITLKRAQPTLEDVFIFLVQRSGKEMADEAR